MNALAASRLAHWWIHGLNASPRARPVANEFNTRAANLAASREARPVAASPSLLRMAQRWLQQMAARQGPQTAEELMAYARSIEHEMPSLAADLRYAAMRHTDAANEKR